MPQSRSRMLLLAVAALALVVAADFWLSGLLRPAWLDDEIARPLPGPVDTPERPAEALTDTLAERADAASTADQATRASTERWVDFMPGNPQQRSGARHDPLLAESEAEGRWLARRGFPTATERDFAMSAPLPIVLQRANATDSIPIRILAEQRYARETSDPDELFKVTEVLRQRAAAHDQPYAWYAVVDAYARQLEVGLPKAHVEGIPGWQMHVRGKALEAMRFAYLLGDHKAGSLYPQLARMGALDPVALQHADNLVMRMLLSATQDPRPGLPTFRKFDPRPLPPITAAPLPGQPPAPAGSPRPPGG